ncbi:hypothetical protein [Nonomuraea sp. SYSU D8015]|uniref:hypothetical protein n=1 Tax=Nonomuraea sp. SYSU D8015 TaxID=2593644 RepID=UPI0016607946|nr:hypothetical protein [Nonomuraea sp. SYSU D8015]
MAYHLPELNAAQIALDALDPLDPAERRRVLTWLIGRYKVDVTDLDLSIAVEAADAAGLPPVRE